MGDKSVFKSKTIWGVILALLGTIVTAGPSLQAVFPGEVGTWIGQAVAVAGCLLAFYGRVKAGGLNVGGSEGIKSLAILLAFLAFACSSVQPKPQEVGQALALAEADYTAIVQTATAALQAGVLDEGVASKLDPIFNRANDALILAHEALGASRDNDVLRWINVVNLAVAEAKGLVKR